MHLACYPTSGESARREKHRKVFSMATSDGQIPQVASTAENLLSKSRALIEIGSKRSRKIRFGIFESRIQVKDAADAPLAISFLDEDIRFLIITMHTARLKRSLKGLSSLGNELLNPCHIFRSRVQCWVQMGENVLGVVLF